MIHTLVSVANTSRFPSNTEASASELLGNPEEMPPCLSYMHTNMFDKLFMYAHNMYVCAHVRMCLLEFHILQALMY